MKAEKQVINHPPFPQLVFGMFFWETKDVLPAWAGTQPRLGGYGSRSGNDPSDGTVNLYIMPPGQGPNPPSPEQVAAYEFLKQNDQPIADAALKAIFDAYPEWRGAYGFDEEERAQFMPDLAAPQALRQLVGLGTVHVLNIQKDGVAYVGFELGCSWDEEHGAGVLLHKDRVIDVGQADTSFTEWPALDDGGQEIGSPG